MYVDRAFQKKTNELVQQRIGALFSAEGIGAHVSLDSSAIETIKQRQGGKATKIVNLVKAIQKAAQDNAEDPFLIAMAERAKAVQESFEDRQSGTEEALAQLLQAVERDEQRRREQVARGLDALTFFVFTTLREVRIPHAESVSKKVGEAFSAHPNWRRSEKELRELRKQVTFAVFAAEDDLNKVTAIVDQIFAVLQKGRET